MRRRSSNSSLDLPDTPSLHPALQGVLESLDVDIEEELALYRRRRSDRPSPQRGRNRQGQRAGVAAAASQLQLPNPSPSRSAAAVVANDQPTQTQPSMGAAVAAATAPLAALATMPPPPPPRPKGMPSGNTQLQSNLATVQQSAAADLSYPDETTVEPDDYLASSEELLRSLADEEKELRSKQEPALLDTLLTPLGIGSMLLLLLSSATLGYLIMNPASLRIAGLDSLFGDRSGSEVASQTASNNAVSEGSATATLPNSPNLASEEFVDLNLSNLGTLPAEPEDQPSPTASASPAPSPTEAATSSANTVTSTDTRTTVQNQADLPTVPIPRAAPSVIAPAPVRSAPRVAAAPVRQPEPVRSAPVQPEPEPAPARVTRPAPPARIAPPPSVVAAPASVPTAPDPAPAAASNPTPAQEEYYYVVTEYSSDRNLEQVREAVPDAYVRNFSDGARVQSGAFNSEEGAAELVRELSEQGISAEVYQPD